jgi:hypothetical protein
MAQKNRGTASDSSPIDTELRESARLDGMQYGLFHDAARGIGEVRGDDVLGCAYEAQELLPWGC